MNNKPVMVRDLPSHKKMLMREKKDFSKEELEKKLESLGRPAISLDDADEFADEDADCTESGGLDDQSDDDQEALLRELARLKKEKADEEARKVKEAQRLAVNQFITKVDPDYSMKLKWTEERVFRNQAIDEPKPRNEFVNDPVRNEYHRKFLQKFLHT